MVCICPPSSFCINWLKANSMESLLTHPHLSLGTIFLSFPGILTRDSEFWVSSPALRSVIFQVLILGSLLYFDILQSVCPKPHLSNWLCMGRLLPPSSWAQLRLVFSPVFFTRSSLLIWIWFRKEILFSSLSLECYNGQWLTIQSTIWAPAIYQTLL